MNHPKDGVQPVINPFSGDLEMVSDFNTGRIATSEYIHTGTIRVTYDLASASFIQDNPAVVIDNDGHVVKV